MQKSGKQKRFRGDAWFDQQVDKRVRKALADQETKFASEHNEDTDEQLLAYVRQFAKELGHTPQAGEIVGGKYITTRFGNWESVMEAAGLPHPGSMPKLQHRLIYKQEFKRQAALFQKERRGLADEKKAARQEKSDIALQEQRAREERDMAWGQEHEEDADEQLLDYLRQCAEELGHSPVTKEVVGGGYIAKRFVTWSVVLTCAGLPLPQGMKAPRQSDLKEYRRQQREKDATTNTVETENTPQSGL